MSPVEDTRADVPRESEVDDAPAATAESKDHAWAVFGRLSTRTRVLLLADAVNAFGVGVVMPFLLIYLSQVRDIDVRVAALALSVTAVSAFSAGLIWGSLLDRFPHRLVMPVVMVLAGVSSSLYAIADRVWIAMAVSVAYGIAMGGVGPVVRTMFATAVPPTERTVFFGLQFAVFNAFVGLGTLAGGLLVDGSLGRYQVLYVLDGITFVFMGIVLLVAPGGPARTATGGGDEDGEVEATSKASYRVMLRDRSLLLVMLTITLAAVFYYGAFQSALPGYLTLADAVTPRGISGAFVVNVVIVVLAQLVIMPRLKRVRQTTWLMLSGVLWTLSWLLVLLAGRTGGTAALALLWGSSVPFAVAETLVTPVLAAILNDIVPDSMRGRANALFALSLTGGAIVGPAVTAALLPVGEGVPLVLALSAGCLIMLIPTGLLRARLVRDVDRPAGLPA